MNLSFAPEIASVVITLLIAFLLAKPAGYYLYHAFVPEKNKIDRFFGPFERWLYRVAGIHQGDQNWKKFLSSLLAFNVLAIVLVYAVFRLQGVLPLNPSQLPGLEPTLAFHTAISFITNADLQHYSGENTISYLSLLIGCLYLNFVAPATGAAAGVAFIRVLAGKTMGNFYVHFTRMITRVLLPIVLVLAFAFVAMGVPQTLEPTVAATTLEGGEQEIARGPMASMIPLKMLGNNGGGVTGVNAAHPFENPTAISNTIQMVLMLILGMAFPFMYGRMVGNIKEGRVIFYSMGTLLVILVTASLIFEYGGNPKLEALGLPHSPGSLEGKELRFGVTQSSLFSVITTTSGTGGPNTMHDTLTPIGGMVALLSMMLGTVYGNVGGGMLSILMYILLSVFLSGLMVGRTPEFLGKKIDFKQMKLIAVTLLVTPFLILVPSAIAFSTPLGYGSISNPGFHGVSQVLYEYTTSATDNGSNFAGMATNTPFWNISTALVLFLARFIPFITLLAVAGSMANKKKVPDTIGTFRTDTPLFGIVLFMIVVIIGALSFLPALVLGPIAEHLTL
ncbi:potassium-transporting ATPase subunit KdpA [Paenibacillus sp. LHD-117]|uniref:potassium-transporting ATPase subunit KdpA n=1 Tax=Paenibacillus sp. LHD-117 TaxID=3071412 RepID=UPI0027E09FFC|nr:potassium-transporting ATPase subunit KdpA [Paenibacillus sp. LHD-117]MDQ6423458.1 potassium-transporting ATPase subunit KdpA [Paenibacillus sp. LHD-117]